MTSPGRLATVCLLLGSFVLSVLASSSHSLHHLLHHDSAAPVHQCLASKLSDGQNDVTPVTLAVTGPVVFSFAAVPAESRFRCLETDPSAPVRGPPVLS